MISKVTYSVGKSHSLYPFLIAALQGTEESRELRKVLVAKPCNGRVAMQADNVVIEVEGAHYEIQAWLDTMAKFTGEEPKHESGFIHTSAGNRKS